MKKKIILALVSLSLFHFTYVSASPTDGTIDTTFKYAWSNNVGWINFNTTGTNIRIIDTQLSGYAWSQNNGWINLRPSNGGVANNGEGALSGSAWGDRLGWINFSGVTIDTNGRFRGQATGDSIGTLTFDCARCDVRTDWRPASARGAVTSSAPASANAQNGLGVPSPPEQRGVTALAGPISPQTTATVAPSPAGTPIAPRTTNIPASPEQTVISALPQALFDIIIQPAIQYGKTYTIQIIIGFILSLSILIYLIRRMKMKKKIDRNKIDQPPLSTDHFNRPTD